MAINDELIISIHAPAKGATILSLVLPPPNHISIHAPAKGATVSSSHTVHCHIISIHAPAKGATVAPVFLLLLSRLFQSTLPRRERR